MVTQRHPGRRPRNDRQRLRGVAARRGRPSQAPPEASKRPRRILHSLRRDPQGLAPFRRGWRGTLWGLFLPGSRPQHSPEEGRAKEKRAADSGRHELCARHFIHSLICSCPTLLRPRFGILPPLCRWEVREFVRRFMAGTRPGGASHWGNGLCDLRPLLTSHWV